jgi:hypothetical protein
MWHGTLAVDQEDDLKRNEARRLREKQRLESIGFWDPPVGYQESGENNEIRRGGRGLLVLRTRMIVPTAKRRRTASTSEEEDEDFWSIRRR